jgi:hypothetical protein
MTIIIRIMQFLKQKITSIYQNVTGKTHSEATFILKALLAHPDVPADSPSLEKLVLLTA